MRVTAHPHGLCALGQVGQASVGACWPIAAWGGRCALAATASSAAGCLTGGHLLAGSAIGEGPVDPFDLAVVLGRLGRVRLGVMRSSVEERTNRGGGRPSRCRPARVTR